MWTFKMFFQDDGEFFEYDPFGMQGTVGTEKALPYLESFLSFLELEPADWEPLIQQTALDLEQFLFTEAPAHADRMMQTLGELSGRHIYFQLLYLQWFARKAAGNIESRMTEELRLLPVQLTAYRKQAQTFLERILDIDQVGRDVRKNMGEAYHFDCPKDDTLFCFEPSPISLGVIRGGDCAEILYPDTIRDLIDFSPGMYPTGDPGPAVQELWAVLPHHRADHGGVLQPSQPVRQALPQHCPCPEVGGEPPERPGFSGVPPGVQTPLRLDQGRETHGGTVRLLAQSRQG